MFGSRRSRYPSFSSRKKKKPVDPILTSIILLIGVYLAWSSYTPTKTELPGSVGSEMRASLDAEKLLPSDLVRSGVFSLGSWTPGDAEQRTPRPMERNLTPHWYNQGIPAKMEVHFTLNAAADFFEVLLADSSGGSYGIRADKKGFQTFFDAQDGTRKVLRKAEFPETQNGYSLILDTTDEHLFLAVGGQLLETSEIPFEKVKRLGASTNLTLSSVSHFNIENANGELEQLR